MRQARVVAICLLEPKVKVIFESSFPSSQITHCILRNKSDTVMLFRKIFGAFFITVIPVNVLYTKCRTKCRIH